MAKRQDISPLVLDEYFAAQDERFLPTLRAFNEPKKLASLTDRWKKDFRPWSRGRILEYLELPLDSLGHEVVVKRLFKHAQEQRDDELMAAFAVAFDRLVRRVRKTRFRHDPQARQTAHEEHLASQRNVLPHVGRQPKHEQLATIDPNSAHWQPRGQLFTYHTRYYLRRRAWRYFRRKGHQLPQAYCGSAALFLRRYTDADVARGENLLDCWSLMHACFRGSAVLEFGTSVMKVKPGRGLSELSAAPDFPELWKEESAAKTLVELLTAAQSRAVRVWAVQLLRREHMEHLGAFSPEQVLELLDHPDEAVQHFAAEMLERSPKLGELPLETWLKLLQTRNPAALESIAGLMQQHVRPEQLTLEQMVDLAIAQPVSVARMGLGFLQNRQIESADDRQAMSRLATARCAGMAGEITSWALSILGTREHYDVDQVSAFFDSLLEATREAAWEWLQAPDAAGRDDPALWSRLIETPYDDIRFNVVRELQRRAKLPGMGPEQVTVVWATVLLGVHRGGRTKLMALKQISRAIAVEPARAEPLLPVLAVAIRSVRMSEVRTGLTAIVSAVEAHPPLAAAVGKHFPELQISEEVAV